MDAYVQLSQDHADMTKKSQQQTNLSSAEIASIALYTVESPFYHILNSVLRNNVDGDAIDLFSNYIWLFMNALSKCPAYTGRMVYRATKANFSAQYIKGQEITWHAFSSATSNIHVELGFLGLEESVVQGTLFHIELTTHRGRSISRYSMTPNEEEVLLPLASRFLVVDTLDTGSGLVIIQLRELPPSDAVLEFPDVSGEEFMLCFYVVVTLSESML